MTAPTYAGSSTTKIGMRATFLLLFYFRVSIQRAATSYQRQCNDDTLLRRCCDVAYKKDKCTCTEWFQILTDKWKEKGTTNRHGMLKIKKEKKKWPLLPVRAPQQRGSACAPLLYPLFYFRLSIQRLINVDATLEHCVDIDATLHRSQVSAWYPIIYNH